MTAIAIWIAKNEAAIFMFYVFLPSLTWLKTKEKLVVDDDDDAWDNQKKLVHNVVALFPSKDFVIRYNAW